MQQGLKTAVKVPCALAEKVSGLWPALKDLARHCNLACKSDIQVQPWAHTLPQVGLLRLLGLLLFSAMTVPLGCISSAVLPGLHSNTGPLNNWQLVGQPL